MLGLFLAGFSIPESGKQIPVEGATSNDWNSSSFWYYPWGRSGVHKGIDIFAEEGTPVVAATDGIVIFTGTIAMGGNVVLMLGAKWRFYYYAHLREISTVSFKYLKTGDKLGSVGSTGNASGKPPHLHFAISRLFPMISEYRLNLPQGWKRMFYIDPNIFLLGAMPS
ncbi:MAG: M23 family metallopeptidase [Methylococcaceae bacterium]|nr:M23 family metallopeptidase [Methylococcaceae bacterium]